jgi:hypothetical protein
VPLGTSEAEINCLGPPLDEDKAFCLAWDCVTTHVLGVEISEHRMHDLGPLRGRFWTPRLEPSRILVGSWRSIRVLVRLDQRRILRFSCLASKRVSEVAYGHNRVALMFPGPEGVHRYRLSAWRVRARELTI